MDEDGEEECIKHYLLMQTPTRLAQVVLCAHTDWAQWFCPQLLSEEIFMVPLPKPSGQKLVEG